MKKPDKPTPGFPLFPHATGRWAKKIKGRLHYFGPWDDPDSALDNYERHLADSKIASLQKSAKPAKPHKDFPLYAHRSGQWAKKIKGRVHYFGAWAKPQAALDKYLDEKDALRAGRKPKAKLGDDVTIKYLIDRFLSDKKADWKAGEIVKRTFKGYEHACKRFSKIVNKHQLLVDLGPSDFKNIRRKLGKGCNAVSLANYVTHLRVMFAYAYDQRMIDRPVDFGKSFQKPDKAALRRAKQDKGLVMFQPDEIQAMLASANPILRTMILLGINCGYGNNDCASLPKSAVDLNLGWINFPRPKTAVQRRCPLWPETVKALAEAIEIRPAPNEPSKQTSDLVFITRQGNRFGDGTISAEMRKLLDKLGIHRNKINFYALRHTFSTIGEARAETPTHFIMGHAPPSDDMPAVYRELVTDERLRTVTRYVRDWVFKRTPLLAVGGSGDEASEPAA